MVDVYLGSKSQAIVSCVRSLIQKCNSVAISIAMKINENGAGRITFSRDFPNSSECELSTYDLVLKRCLSILSFLILVSNVEGGTPSFAAAPDAPAILPLVFASASSMICLS